MLQRRLALQDLAQDFDVFAGARHRLAEGHAVPALDDLRSRRADAQQEAVVRQGLQGQRRHRGAGRRTGLHLHDAHTGLDARRAGQDPGRRRHRVGAVGLAAPYRAVAEPLGFQDLVEGEVVAVIAQKHPEPHGHPFRKPASKGIASAAKRSICWSRSS
jgi:hypothetical protein